MEERGQSLSESGSALDKHASSTFDVAPSSGAIVPATLRRSRLALKMSPGRPLRAIHTCRSILDQVVLRRRIDPTAPFFSISRSDLHSIEFASQLLIFALVPDRNGLPGRICQRPLLPFISQRRNTATLSVDSKATDAIELPDGSPIAAPHA